MRRQYQARLELLYFCQPLLSAVFLTILAFLAIFTSVSEKIYVFTMAFPSKNGSEYEDSMTGLVLLPLIWIFICTRIYVRAFLTRRPGWDDLAAVFAAVSLYFIL
jgi:uncharacterized membrane protein (DUF106 family)